MKLLFAFAATATLLSASSSSKPAPLEAPSKPITVGDPLGTPDAPKMVSFKSIHVLYQPPAPPYPPLARVGGIHGDVLVEVWINDKGIPFNAATLLGPKELAETAAKYIVAWRFAPVVSDGKAVPARFRMMMPFRLNAGGVYQALPKNLTD